MAASLSPREEQILTLLLRGYDNADIGKELNMARRTVKAHMNRLFIKYGLNDFQGVKRVKLAVIVYWERRAAGIETKVTDGRSE